MELRLQPLSPHFVFFNTARASKCSDSYSFHRSIGSPNAKKSKAQVGKKLKISSALPETAASIAVAATVVGAAATLLVRRTKASAEIEAPTKICEDCGGSGVCPECNGEGFVPKKLSEESAERARMMSKNAATRYTAGLPKKWSYCTKCNASRSCSLCDGSGKISL
ncbi:PREDICTED: uncharacterized protein LOC109192996 [Ipomoea nil]|uniref:uncharacterized protein LOC109192996 n=1 Tax=Ipomoea nil TaxID=35883 RepID=UPI000900FD4F|nr:PREDICTED: uncharacterized protein LOC109192996 [Ipomoea nil]